MAECALQKLKISLIGDKNTVDGVTKQIITKWLNRDDVRNSNIKEVSILIIHHGLNSIFFQTSNTKWSSLYSFSDYMRNII